MENLEQATHALSKHMYDAAQAASGASGGRESPESPADGTASTGADDNVIDAEFEKK